MIALDLFAGTGWGVACKWLGIHENGVEIMPEAVATREAAGMKTIYRDVWDGLLDASMVPAHDLHISSPPCQTFSAAGSGAGRRALNDVLAAISEGLYKDPSRLFELTEKLDPKTALVLTPLAHIYRERPQFVALEQVPSVLPVWQACAEVMRTWGYSVECAVLNAEQYGVPQTRRRAILVGRNDGLAVSLPTPTHSRYYSTKPTKLDDGVLPWVSMADALGKPDHLALRSNYGTGGDSQNRGMRQAGQPAPTITSKADRMKWSNGAEARKLTLEEAAVLQSYPNIVYRNGNQANAARRPVDAPAPTIMFGARANKVEWMTPEAAADPAASGVRVSVEQAAVLQSYPQWVHERPAPTIVGTRRSEGGLLVGRQLADNSRRDMGGHQTSIGLHPGQLAAVRVTGDEGAALQPLPTPFPFQGTKTKQFLQIGNAVPPLLAWAILAELTSTPAPLDDWAAVFAEANSLAA